MKQDEHPQQSQGFRLLWSLFSCDPLACNSKRVPPQDPYYFKNGQINRITKVSSTFRPTESDSEKNWVVTWILGAETGFEITCITYITN